MKITYEFIQKIFNRKIELKNNKDKILLSKYTEYIPMYDIYTDNIYYINYMKLYYRLVKCHFRFITDEIVQWIKNKKEKATIKDSYNNMLAILNNYDIDVLEKTSYETLYRYSPDLGLTISICKRNSFHPYSYHLTPYYTKMELIKLGMNNMLINKLEPSNLTDKNLHYKICKKVSKNDISSHTIINHMKNIIDNKSIGWIVFYSMTGSYMFNKILRNKLPINQYMYDGLVKITDTMNNIEFDNDYYFYRFIWDDEFLQKLHIGDIFTDNGFISTTRDPFYSPGIKMDFGLILIRINIPKHLKGVGLLIENFSMFPKEEEFLIQPLTKLKLKAKDDKATYYHTNEKFERLIKKKYEFDMVGINKGYKYNVIHDNTIPIIDITMTIDGYDRISLFKSFLDTCDELGQCRINDMIFIAQWFDSTGSYKHMYRNNTKDGFILTHYVDGYPELSIEMGDNLYVNYLKTIVSYDTQDVSIDNDIISHIARIFRYKNAYIYFDYSNFTNFEDNYNSDKEFLSTKLYCSTIYNYYKNGLEDINKYYKYDNGYWKLDKIGKTKISEEINLKLPKELQKKVSTWKELYIEIVEKYFYLYDRMKEWMDDNFDNISSTTYYTFNIIFYLEKQGYNITDFPTFKHISTFDRGDLFNRVFNDNIRRID